MNKSVEYQIKEWLTWNQPFLFSSKKIAGQIRSEILNIIRKFDEKHGTNESEHYKNVVIDLDAEDGTVHISFEPDISILLGVPND